MYKACTHFIGFRGDAFISAIKVFGRPDFIHRDWDKRAVILIAPGDRVIFAVGTDQGVPNKYSFDDSGVF